MKRFAFKAVVLLTLAACNEPTRPAAPRSPQADVTLPQSSQYTVTDIGTLGGTFTQAFRINEAGQVIGGSTTSSGDLHAFLWTQETGMIDLGTLAGSTFSLAWGINNQGVVVGEIDLPSGHHRAFVWTAAGGMRDLGTLGGDDALARDVNNKGEIVGVSTVASGGPAHAVVWTAQGQIRDVGTFNGTNTHFRTVDNAGTTAAGSDNLRSGGHEHAVLWHSATGFQDLGTLGNDPSSGWRVNDLGQVVGISGTATVCCHGFLWTNATGMVDLGTLNGPDGTSDAFDISESGRVVGSTTTSADPNNTHAYIWTQTTGMRLLPDLPGETDSGGFGINEAGQIIGFADTPDGRTHGILWTPRAQ